MAQSSPPNKENREIGKCSNCGATFLRLDKNILVCPYCGSSFTNPLAPPSFSSPSNQPIHYSTFIRSKYDDKIPISSLKDDKDSASEVPPQRPVFNTIFYITLSILLACFFSISYFIYYNYKRSKYEKYVNPHTSYNMQKSGIFTILYFFLFMPIVMLIADSIGNEKIITVMPAFLFYFHPFIMLFILRRIDKKRIFHRLRKKQLLVIKNKLCQ
jgi:hypothetical protein